MTSASTTQSKRDTAAFDREKCKQRNRLAARRDGVNSAPLRLLHKGEVKLAALGEEPELRYAHGTLPKSEEDAIERINALRGEDAEPLSLEDVYIHYAEAGNNNFIPDRFMFLGETTLRNVAREAAQGFAFMNSHRTGGLSTPAELPFGKTFAGRYEEYRDGRKRALVGMYMLRGVHPSGSSGPSTDDLNRMILGGTLPDVSLGLYGGTRVCDLCANELSSEDCGHVPGTKRNISPEQATSQKARGVKGGEASFTYDDGHSAEFSAVYDGAVPGAGFQKAIRLARRHELAREDLEAVKRVYASVLREGDLAMSEELQEAIESATENGFVKAFKKLGFGKNGGKGAQRFTGTVEETDDDPGDEGADDEQEEEEGFTELTALPVTQSPEYLALKAKHEAARSKQVQEAASAFTTSQKRANKLLPAEEPAALALYQQLARDDDDQPVAISLTSNAGEAVQLAGRVALLERLFADRPAHSLTRELMRSDLPEGTAVLSNDDRTATLQKEYEETREWAQKTNPGKKSRNGTNGKA